MSAMLRQRRPRLTAWVLVFLAICGCAEGRNADLPAPTPNEQPKLAHEKVVQPAKSSPFSDKVIEAWKAANAHVGWLEVNSFGYSRFSDGSDKAQTQALPAFTLQGLQDGVLSKLPDPGQPFGLLLDHSS